MLICHDATKIDARLHPIQTRHVPLIAPPVQLAAGNYNHRRDPPKKLPHRIQIFLRFSCTTLIPQILVFSFLSFFPSSSQIPVAFSLSFSGKFPRFSRESETELWAFRTSRLGGPSVRGAGWWTGSKTRRKRWLPEYSRSTPPSPPSRDSSTPSEPPKTPPTSAKNC